MNLRARLSERVHIEDIREVLHFIQDDERLREEVYQLIFDENHIVSYQALWVCTHFSKADVEWLSRNYNRNYAPCWKSWSPTYWFPLSVPYEKTS